MRYAFIASIVFACGSAFAGEEASVLVAQPAAPAPAVVAAPCCDGCAGACATAGSVRTRTRYRIVNEGCDACTGRPTRSVARGVVRGTGEVVRGVGATAVNVITLPVRACRAGRCCCN